MSGRAIPALLLLSLLCAGQEAAPTSLRQQLARTARELAGSGRGEAAAALCGLLAELGHSEPALATLRTDCERRLAKAGEPAAELPRQATRLRTVAGKLAALLTEHEGEAQQRLARVVVALDAGRDDAQEVLGNVRHGEEWVDRAQLPLIERRGEISAAVLRARRLEVSVESGDEGHALLERFEGRRGHTVRAGRLSLHSNAFLRHKLARVAREVLRASALSSWLRTGVLEVPKTKRPLGVVLFESTETYQRWVDDWVARGFIRREYHELVRGWTFYHAIKQNLVVSRPRTEASLQALALLTNWFDVCDADYGARAQPCLTAGHVGWLSLNFFGAAPAGYGNMSVKERRRETHTTTGREPALTREFFLRLQKAGLAGSRHWIRYLAARGEDPPWSRSMVDQLADIAGDDRLKSIFVVEYLQEAGRLQEFLKGTLDRKQQPLALFRATVGEPLARFESRWREWMVPALRADLVTRLAGSSGRKRDPGAEELLDTLASIRARAWPEGELDALWIDPSLSAGARAHASYLRLHPEQAAAWPDAHEEWPDREGFSAKGCWAAGHSVIISNVSGPRRAIEGWMGTFYHRLPLLDPGVMGIGWGLDSGFAVLDMSSLVRPAGETKWVAWPPDGARGVPRSFHAGEIPHPVPGEDQSRWGYPITLQFFGSKDTPRCSLELWQGSERVDCHLSTPPEPTNAELAPAGAFCLIPKQTLKPNTKYRVVARNTPTPIEWHFST